MPEISSRQFAFSLVAVVLVVLLGGRALRADAGTPPAGAVPAGGLTATVGAPSTGPNGAAPGGGLVDAGGAGRVAGGPAGVGLAEAPERLLVHVAGRVQRPGVYELGPGARVRDALARAGGGRAGADLDGLNLAAKVTDGQQVLVARRDRPGAPGAVGPGTPRVGNAVAGGRPAPGTAAGGGAGPSVDVNQADVAELETLNGVGPAIAAKIVEWRTQNGPFATVDDLTLVPGIGPKTVEGMRGQAVT